jgi:3-hydroxyisobutyrate dehydrogenase-like beta-hydroxyacid dehydrogenase
VFERHRRVLESLCAKLIYGGALGSAKVMKLANNQVAAVTIAALSEAWSLIVRSGADPVAAWEAMSSSWAASAMLGHRPPVPGLVAGSPADQGYQHGFPIDYMLKDLDAILATGAQLGARQPTAELARAMFGEAAARGDGGLDVSGLYRTLADSGAP